MNVLTHAGRALWREARSGDLLTLAAALVIAVAVMTAVGTLINRVTLAVSSNAAQIIGGDFGYSARRPIPDAIAALARERGLSVSRAISFPTVLFVDERSLLADIKAVDAAYPLRGELRAGSEGVGADGNPSPPPAPGEAYADARLLDLLGIQPGASVAFGDGSLRIGKRLYSEPDSGGELFQLAPRLLVNVADVERMGLLGPGSRATHRLMLAGSPAQIAAVRAAVRKAGLDQGLRPLSVENTQQAVRSAFTRAQRFLALAALLSVLLAGVATALAASRFASTRIDQVAILRCLGAPQARVLAALALQLLLLTIPASLLGVALGLLAQQGLVGVLGSLLPGRLPLPSAEPALTGVAVGLLLLLGFGLPPLLRLRGVPPMRVLNRSFAPVGAGSVAATLIGIGAAVLLVVLASNDLRLAGLVLGGLSALAAFAAVLGLWLLKLIRSTQARWRGAWRLGLAGLVRRRGLSVAQWVGLSLSLCALLLLAAIGPALLDQWQARLPRDTPNWFLLNIQPEQAPAIEDALRTAGVREPDLQPFATGRLLAINGETPRGRDRWRDADGQGDADGNADRPLNMTWRHDFPPANTLLAGSFWAPDSTAAEASIEQGWAERFGIGVGDTLRLGIGDREFEVRVSNLRKADWDSFRVNFFVLLNAGALADAPHNLVSSFYLAPTDAHRLAAITRTWPNVSLLDVDAILGRVRAVIAQVSEAVQLVLGFSLLAGVVVLLAALQATAGERRFESAVLRTLGARRTQLRSAVLIEFALLGGVAALLALVATAVLGQLLAQRMFSMPLALPWPTLLLGAGLGVALTMAAGWAGTRRILSTPPALALRNA